MTFGQFKKKNGLMLENLTNNDAGVTDSVTTVSVVIENVETFKNDLEKIQYHMNEIWRIYRNMPQIKSRITVMKDGIQQS